MKLISSEIPHSKIPLIPRTPRRMLVAKVPGPTPHLPSRSVLGNSTTAVKSINLISVRHRGSILFCLVSTRKIDPHSGVLFVLNEMRCGEKDANKKNQLPKWNLFRGKFILCALVSFLLLFSPHF